MITRIRQSLVAAALAGAVLAASPAWALPTEAAVQAQVQKGRYDEAESMMAEVLAAKPDSPKAHYLYAQILAKRGRLDLARQH
ncbi:MAG: tetratricopeptide repeat protein, partial [Burkholderiaceae bacterium]